MVVLLNNFSLIVPITLVLWILYTTVVRTAKNFFKYTTVVGIAEANHTIKMQDLYDFLMQQYSKLCAYVYILKYNYIEISVRIIAHRPILGQHN